MTQRLTGETVSGRLFIGRRLSLARRRSFNRATMRSIAINIIAVHARSVLPRYLVFRELDFAGIEINIIPTTSNFHRCREALSRLLIFEGYTKLNCRWRIMKLNCQWEISRNLRDLRDCASCQLLIFRDATNFKYEFEVKII